MQVNESDLLAPSELAAVLDQSMSRGADFAEIFVEDVQRNSASLDDGRIENLASSYDRGVGIRVIVGDTTGFAHTTDLSKAGLGAAAKVAAEAAGGGGSTNVVALQRRPTAHLPMEIDPRDIPKSDKIALLREAEAGARSQGEAISQVRVGYGDTVRRIQVANSEGTFASDHQTRSQFSVSTVASGDAGLQTGYEVAGHQAGFELFNRYDVAQLGRAAATRAITKLTARPAPSGTVPVVIGPGSGGVMFHEACGHGLEADLVRKGASVFANRIGELVASPLVTIVDDGGMSGEWGQIGIDDEGNPARRNVLIKDGVLVDYMWDGKRARKEGRASSGNGRRQSYRHLPMVRMTNTYLGAGTSDPVDIIAGVDYGVYIAKLGGGQVDTGSGDFVFGMVEAYLIEDGEITAPLREGQLIGNGPKVLQLIDAVGNDFAMGSPGTCGKDGQGVPVGDGVPTLRVTELTIGGTAA